MLESSLRHEVIYDKSRPLESTFRNTASRVLDFLVLNWNFDYSASEISRTTQIPLRTLQRVLPHLVEKELIKETGKVGNTKMYILNGESKLAGALRQYVLAAININIDNARKHQRSSGSLRQHKRTESQMMK
jgi:cell division protein ZapA (FtsZ GTPase activity inhibitor)